MGAEAKPSTVLITGCSTGIGRAAALFLAAEGFHVLAGVRRPEDAASLEQEALARPLSGSLQGVLLDVTNEAAIAEVRRQIEADDSPLVGLVNNAGIAISGPLEQVALEEVRRVFEVNLLGMLRLTQALLPRLRADAGRVVNVGSVLGELASPYLGVYSASKFAVRGLSDALRIELRPWNIPVVLIEPGSVRTAIWGKLPEPSVADAGDEVSKIYGRCLEKASLHFAKVARQGADSERIALLVHKVLTARRPRPRYLVGWDAQQYMFGATWLPDRLRDWMVAKILGLK